MHPSSRCFAFLGILSVLVTSCGGDGASSAGGSRASRFVEGKDYTVLERRRFLDETAFDRPVEAFSLLFPKGWKIEGGVKWRGVQECRGDIVSNVVKASSPDGAIQFEIFPSRTFGWADDRGMMRAMQASAQQGGCQLNQPFDAAGYIQTFAQRDLSARASDIRADESRAAFMKQLDDQANGISQQYGTGSQQTTTMAFGALTWPDGTEGILHVGVTNIITRKRAAMFIGATTFSTTSVFHCVMTRFPSARKEEATKLFGTIQAGFRQNPIWKQAKDNYLTQLGNIEHAGRMERIRLAGEQSRAYAAAQSTASEQRMRDWENQQASQDAQHKAFVQTIREVETWKDASGSVELSSGYNQAWSRGDGSYILSNTPGFDPSSVFQDQNWHEMKRTP
jgi:hypothetical protein